MNVIIGPRLPLTPYVLLLILLHHACSYDLLWQWYSSSHPQNHLIIMAQKVEDSLWHNSADDKLNYADPTTLQTRVRKLLIESSAGHSPQALATPEGRKQQVKSSAW